MGRLGRFVRKVLHFFQKCGKYRGNLPNLPNSRQGLFRAVRGLLFDVADELGEIGMSQHLPDSEILSIVIPVVIDDALQARADGEIRRFTIVYEMFLQLGRGQLVKILVHSVRHSVPRFPHLGE